MLDEESAALWAGIRAGGATRVDESPLPEARAAMRARQLASDPGPELHRVADVRIARNAGPGLEARVYVPDDPHGILVFCHGGGWVLGDIDGCDHYARRLADRIGLVVVSPGYRLAPEHPFPAAVEDAWAAMDWTRSQLGRGLPRLPLLVGGESAGANLAAVVAQEAVRAGIELAGQVLIYPVVDARFDRPSYSEPENQLLVDGRLLRWLWDQYVPDVRDRDDPRASPIAGTLIGLPPAIVVTAEHDPLRDEGEDYARLLVEAGVDVRSRRFDGQMHGFATMPLLPKSESLIDYLRDSLSEMLPAAP